MTIDSGSLHKNENQKQPGSFFCGIFASGAHVGKNIFVRSAVWYGFWLSIVIALYWPVLPSLPYRDHPYLMLNHQLAESDSQWFWSMLSYNRTRILLPGDYFAFRPVHMVVIALQDIFLRYHLTAQGIVNCAQFACAAFLFCSLVKRFVGVFAAIALTSLWITPLAGFSIITWQHIAPYILCPAFFMAALRILDADDLALLQHTRNVLAAICVGLATLAHEIGVATALSVSLFALLPVCRDNVRRRQLLFVFLMPVVCSLLLNGLDYFVIHPQALLLGSSDVLSSQLTVSMIFNFIGAIGTALVASPALHLEQLPDGFTIWQFYNESQLLLHFMAVLVLVILVTATVITVRDMRNNGLTGQALFMMVLLSLFMAIFVVCAFRMYTRDPGYMSKAPYYYALFSLALSGMLAGILCTAKNKVANGVSAVISVVVFFHVSSSQAYFHMVEEQQHAIVSAVNAGRKIMMGNPGLCFSGSIPLSTTFGPLFQDVSCSNRPGGVPLYMYSDGNNGFSLSSVSYSSEYSGMIPEQIPPALRLPAHGGWVTSLTIPYGHDLRFTVAKAENIAIALADQSGVQQSITIERNLIKRSYQKTVWSSPLVLEGTLDRDSAAGVITYQLGFTRENISLFADGRLIAGFPASAAGTATLNMLLRTPSKKPVDIGNMFISERPSSGALVVTPRYILTRQ